MAILAAATVLGVSPAVYAQADTNNATETRPQRPRRGMVTVEGIDKAVTLTEDEKPKVKAAVDEYDAAIKAAREADQSERRSKYQEARTALNDKLKGILTPDQFTKYEEAFPARGRRGGGGGNGGGNQ
ncbi:MAG TPA: hypothetical protein VN873_05200 [Candidatus Angelobacter sp.]|nr:hypothetical protein [Candidatus Angelobacter sp.]